MSIYSKNVKHLLSSELTDDIRTAKQLYFLYDIFFNNVVIAQLWHYSHVHCTLVYACFVIGQSTVDYCTTWYVH